MAVGDRHGPATPHLLADNVLFFQVRHSSATADAADSLHMEAVGLSWEVVPNSHTALADADWLELVELIG